MTRPIYRRGGDDTEFLQTWEWAEVLLSEVERLGLCPERRRALDFGCEVGRLSWVLDRHFESVRVLDIASSMIAKARELHRDCENCLFEVHEDDDLNRFADGTFDLVMCFLVLQRPPSPVDIAFYLGELVRVLAPK